MKLALMIEGQEGVTGAIRERKQRLDEAAAQRAREQLHAYADAGVERMMLQQLEHEDVGRVAVLGEVASRLS